MNPLVRSGICSGLAEGDSRTLELASNHASLPEADDEVLDWPEEVSSLLIGMFDGVLLLQSATELRSPTG